MTREEAINEIKSWAIPSEKGREVLETLIPELTESEDERIRRELKEAFAAYDIESKWNGIPIRSIFSWLEKSAKSERVIKAARRVLNNWLDGTDCPDVSGDFTELEYAIRKYDGEEKQKESLHIQETCKENAEKQNEQKPVPFSCGHENDAEWSEEDENALKYIHELISWGCAEKFMDTQTAHDMRKWVNEHLRPSWKPSEEQMEALDKARRFIPYNCDVMDQLYEQLKKL